MFKSRYLDVSIRDDSVVLSYPKPFVDRFGRKIRWVEIRFRLKHLLRHKCGYSTLSNENAIEIPLDLQNAEDIAQAISDVDREIDALAIKPLTPKNVRKALGITGAERVRWLKDGRLPAIGGPSSFRSGHQSVHFQTYDAETIAAIAADPQTLLAWRKADEQADLAKRETRGFHRVSTVAE